MARSSIWAMVVWWSVLIVVESKDPLGSRRDGIAGVLTPVGWWYTLRVKGGNFCGLRDFPPLPQGFGTSHVYCIDTKYEHFWMWRLIKAPGTGPLSSGDEVLLSLYQPMYHYCRSAARVECGVGRNEATTFVIEKQDGSGVIDLVRDGVYLKVGASYCGLVGTGPGQLLRCVFSTKSSATAFQLPASNYASVQLINSLSNNTCGGDFYAMYTNPPLVSCPKPYIGIATNLTVALRTPGADALTSGSSVVFKVYEDLYTYQVGTWKVDANKKVYSDGMDPSTASPAQWFSINTVPSSPAAGGGNALASGMVVAVRSSATGQFCGIISRGQAAMYCDRAGPITSLPAGYTYTYISSQASLRPYLPRPIFEADNFPPAPRA